MNKLFFYTLLFVTIFLLGACGDDPETVIDFDYHAHIDAPTNEDKHVDDVLSISVNFESHTGETVHHVNVRIYNKADNTEVYNGPTDAHVHKTEGSYVLEDALDLSNANGVEAHSDWVLEAKVWGHEAGVGEVIETVEFHVHP